MSSENFILKIIKYTPLLFIIILSFLTTSYISYNYATTLKKEKEKIQKDYIKLNRDVIQNNINRISNYINDTNNKSNNSLKKEMKQQVSNAHNMMVSIYDKFKDIKTKEEIVLIIKTALGNIRFNNGTGYFFIYDLDGVSILHPAKPEQEGINLFNIKDVNGTFIIQEAIKIAKSEKEEGYQTWMFNKPNGLSKEYKKIGFIKKFKPYNWFIGIGEYVEDFQSQVKKDILEHIKSLEYEDTEYIFIIDKKGDFLLTKSGLSNILEIGKKSLFIETFNDFVNSQKEDTYLEYVFIDENKKQSKKTSYLKKVQVNKWVIGTGFNLNKLNLKIKEKQKELEKEYTEQISFTLIIAVIMTILLLLISIFISKRLEKKFLNYKENLQRQVIENRSQKEILLRAQEVAHIGDWKLDLQTNKSFWSNEIIRIFGFNKNNKDNFGPELLLSIIFSEDISNFETSLNDCINLGIEHKCIFRIKRADNKIKWIESRGRLDKDKLSMIGTIQDITESKNLEIEKNRKDELFHQQSKMAAMGEMIGNIAHQWRQPLSTISIASTGAKLQKEMNCLSDSELHSALTVINNSAQYLSTTIDDFRDFFNPSNNKIVQFNISGTFNKTLNLLKTQFVSNKIEFIQNIENFELLSIENELIQVLINILNNARDALIPKKNQRKLILVNTYTKDNIAYLEIIDNAGGIEKIFMDRIFEPYFTTKHKSQGTGIGLYMSKEIIEKHLKGNLIVSNEDYTFEDIDYIGAKFTIVISNIII